MFIEVHIDGKPLMINTLQIVTIGIPEDPEIAVKYKCWIQMTTEVLSYIEIWNVDETYDEVKAMIAHLQNPMLMVGSKENEKTFDDIHDKPLKYDDPDQVLFEMRKNSSLFLLQMPGSENYYLGKFDDLCDTPVGMPISVVKSVAVTLIDEGLVILDDHVMAKNAIDRLGLTFYRLSPNHRKDT